MGKPTKPNRPGWYWFLPDEKCPTPTGLLRITTPVVLLVGVDKPTRDMPPARLLVRFPKATLYVDEMSGDWESIRKPPRLHRIALKRIMDTQRPPS